MHYVLLLPNQQGWDARWKLSRNVYSKFKFIVKMTRSRTTDSTSYTVLTQRFEPLLGINGYTHTHTGTILYVHLVYVFDNVRAPNCMLSPRLLTIIVGWVPRIKSDFCHTPCATYPDLFPSLTKDASLTNNRMGQVDNWTSFFPQPNCRTNSLFFWGGGEVRARASFDS